MVTEVTEAAEAATTPSHMPTFKHLTITSPSPAVCHCALNRPPVNALNTAVWTELQTLLTHLETVAFPQTTRILLITSSARGNIFSAGNDLTELYTPMTTQARFHAFWLASTTFLTRLYATPLTTVAAVRGATPAAGCVMALCCDVRLALADTVMGLNEVAIGLSVPAFWARLYVRTANCRAVAERLLQAGDMITATEASALRIVDDVVHGGPDDLLTAALAVANEWADRPGVAGRAETKHSLRAGFAKDWMAFADEEARAAWQMLCRPGTVRLLGDVMRALGGRPARM